MYVCQYVLEIGILAGFGSTK
jgi:small subunit ribosomal protein S7